MNRQSVVIKSNKQGLIVMLDDQLSFEGLLNEVREKFTTSKKFFEGAKMAITFSGRTLSEPEQNELIYTITESCGIEILCVLDYDELKEQCFQRAVQERLRAKEMTDGQFFRGNVAKGQLLESETSIVIIGDVLPGAKVVSKGNIVILGSARGELYAGAAGNDEAHFISAFDFQPSKVHIDEIILDNYKKNKTEKRSFFSLFQKKKTENTYEPQIAYAINGKIMIENMTADREDKR